LTIDGGTNRDHRQPARSLPVAIAGTSEALEQYRGKRADAVNLYDTISAQRLKTPPVPAELGRIWVPNNLIIAAVAPVIRADDAVKPSRATGHPILL
jgi:hypothetical protein